MAKRACTPDRVDARQEATHPLAVVAGAEFRPAPACPGIHGVAESLVREETASVVDVRRNDRDLRAREFERELVLLEDRRVGPALGAIELHDDRGAVLAADLVDPILVTVERQHAAVAAMPERLDRTDDDVGRQRGIRVRGIHCFDCTGSRTLPGTSP